MAKKKAKRIPAVITTREQLESTLGSYAAQAIALAAVTAELDAQINTLRAQYEERIAELQTAADDLFADLEAWASLHPDQFAGKKSVDLLHGTLGFRTGNPAVKTLKGVTWAHVLEQLKACNLKDYVRVEETVNKDAILADREKLGPVNLASLGMVIDQTERFYVDPKTEEV